MGVYMSVFSRICHKEKKHHQYVHHENESNRFFYSLFFSIRSKSIIRLDGAYILSSRDVHSIYLKY